MLDQAKRFDGAAALNQLADAERSGRLSHAAAKNVRIWLTEPWYEEYAPEVARHLAAGMWRELEDAFWTVLPFGTGGRRGRMYSIGTNAINDRTIGESAQGLADYIVEVQSVTQVQPDSSRRSCAIAYDTRHRSLDFARLCAEVLAAADFTVNFFDGHRSTPELSLAVRRLGCACGIMVTASHNPPSDNAVKVYWSTGGQLLDEEGRGVIDKVGKVRWINRRPFAEAVAAGRVAYCQDEIDAAYVQAVRSQSLGSSRAIKVIYSPLHGVGATAVLPALAADGFEDVELFAPHATPDGDFPNVPGHVSNPENPTVFDSIIERARQVRADLILATDPDCDRVGCAAPLTVDSRGPWGTLTGNQIGALLAEFVLDARTRRGDLTPDHYVVKTLVTTELIRRIADAFGAQTYGNLHVGFKWIGGLIDEVGPDRFVFGAEESHGYLVGTYARDKDGAVAAMLLAELAAKLKAQGQTLHGHLSALFRRFGCHQERTISVTMPGAEGMSRMTALMAQLREQPPATLAGIAVQAVRDYAGPTITQRGQSPRPLDAPRGDMVILDLAAEGNYVAVRPSGTEPKVKFYMFTYKPPAAVADVDAVGRTLAQRLDRMQADLTELTGTA